MGFGLRHIEHRSIGMTGRGLKSKMRLHTAMLSGNVVTLCPADRHIQFHDSGQHMAGSAFLNLGARDCPWVIDFGDSSLDALWSGIVGGQIVSVKIQCSRIRMLCQELLGYVPCLLVSQLDGNKNDSDQNCQQDKGRRAAQRLIKKISHGYHSYFLLYFWPLIL